MLFSDDDDDVVVIGLWIIAIGFIILAINKTSKLNNGSENGTELLPPVPVPTDSTPTSHNSNYSAEDEQFKQIQMQLEQLRNGISELKKNPKII